MPELCSTPALYTPPRWSRDGPGRVKGSWLRHCRTVSGLVVHSTTPNSTLEAVKEVFAEDSAPHADLERLWEPTYLRQP